MNILSILSKNVLSLQAVFLLVNANEHDPSPHPQHWLTIPDYDLVNRASVTPQTPLVDELPYLYEYDFIPIPEVRYDRSRAAVGLSEALDYFNIWSESDFLDSGERFPLVGDCTKLQTSTAAPYLTYQPSIYTTTISPTRISTQPPPPLRTMHFSTRAPWVTQRPNVLGEMKSAVYEDWRKVIDNDACDERCLRCAHKLKKQVEDQIVKYAADSYVQQRQEMTAIFVQLLRGLTTKANVVAVCPHLNVTVVNQTLSRRPELCAVDYIDPSDFLITLRCEVKGKKIHGVLQRAVHRLCTECNGLRIISNRFRPNYLNVKICNPLQRQCLSGHGSCVQQYEPITVYEQLLDGKKLAFNLMVQSGCECAQHNLHELFTRSSCHAQVQEILEYEMTRNTENS